MPVELYTFMKSAKKAIGLPREAFGSVYTNIDAFLHSPSQRFAVRLTKFYAPVA